jgi:hypothetical protein
VGDVIPDATLIRFLIVSYAVGIRSQLSHRSVVRTTPPVRVRVSPKYPALDLDLQTTILFFGRLVHRPTILARVTALHNIGDPPNQPPELAVERVGAFADTLADFVPIVASPEHSVRIKFAFPPHFPDLLFKPFNIQIRLVPALGIGRIRNQGVPSVSFERIER